MALEPRLKTGILLLGGLLVMQTARNADAARDRCDQFRAARDARRC